MPVFQNPHLRPWDIESRVCSAYQELHKKLRVVVLLKTDTVQKEGGRCLSTLHWISNSHSQMCAPPAGKASTQFISVPCHQATTHSAPPMCIPVSGTALQGHCSSLPWNKVLQTHTGESLHSGSNLDLCTTSGLHINAQLGAFQEGQHTTAQNYNSPHYWNDRWVHVHNKLKINFSYSQE